MCHFISLCYSHLCPSAGVADSTSYQLMALYIKNWSFPHSEALQGFVLKPQTLWSAAANYRQKIKLICNSFFFWYTVLVNPPHLIETLLQDALCFCVLCCRFNLPSTSALVNCCYILRIVFKPLSKRTAKLIHGRKSKILG